MWPSPQGWWVKERGEVRDWGQAHWSASFFQRHPTTRSNMLQDIRKCGRMTRRWDVVGWKDCAHLALHHPWSLVISGRKARRTMRRERGSSRSLYEKEESWTREEAQRAFDSRQHMLECWQGEENVEYASRSAIHRTSSNLVHWGKSPWFPRSWSPCTSPCWQEQMKPFKFHFVGRSAPQFHSSLSIELILEHKSLQKPPNTLALNFDSLDLFSLKCWPFWVSKCVVWNFMVLE